MRPLRRLKEGLEEILHHEEGLAGHQYVAIGNRLFDHLFGVVLG